MIKRVEESYKRNALAILGGPFIKIVEAFFDLLIPLFMKAIIDLNQYNEVNNIDNTISRSLAFFIRLFPQIGENRAISDTLIGGIVILIMGIVGFFLTMIAQYIAARVSLKVSCEVRDSLFEKIIHLSKKEKRQFGTDHLLTTLNSDTYQLQAGVNIFTRLLVRAPIIIFGSLIISFFLDWRIGLAFSATVPLILFVVVIILRKASVNYVDIQSKLDDISTKSTDVVDGARVVRAFNNQDKEIKDFQIESSSYKKKSIKVNKINSLINPLTFAITSLALIIIVLLLENSLLSNDPAIKTSTSSTLIAEMAYLAQIFFATVQLTGVLLDLTKARVSRRRINNILTHQYEITNPINGVIKEINDNEELIRFDNVYFSYKDNSDVYILNDVNFSLRKGETLGIIGSIGSGKTTIINLIMRFFDTSKGTLLYKGINIRDYDLDSLRNDIGLVNQRSNLFAGTIKSNFLMANPMASKEEIIESLKAAQAYEFVKQYDDFINHEVKEKGTNFSGGQKQRLTIARALIKNPELLILDDSTSALDLLTDKKIRNYLKEEKKMSKIIISSRVATIMGADNIIVIDQGRIVGQGKHEKLLKDCPIYSEIYHTQIKKGNYD